MNNFANGTYRGITEGLTFDFRIERSLSGDQVSRVSGDISRGLEFVATLSCHEPHVSDDGRTLTGDIVFRGNPELFSGTLYLNADPRGIGSFQVSVDLEGGYRDVFAGRLDWQGSFMRRITIEIDGIEGTRPPTSFTLRDSQTSMTIEKAFEAAGFDVNVVIDSFPGQSSQSARNNTRGYSYAEIHAAMTQQRSHVPADRLHTHVFVCSYLLARNGHNVLGVMYDFNDNDLNRRPREGVAVFYDHPMLSDPRFSEELRNREYLFTVIHEIGHALNLLHSFEKARPSALSWMNYPDLYPRGQDLGDGYNGTQEFWRRFKNEFDVDELSHLHHASPRELRAGGFPFGVFEEGSVLQLGANNVLRGTRLGANPLRATRDVQLHASPVKSHYDLGEPVFLKIEVENAGIDPVYVPDALDPSEGYLRLSIRNPNGQVFYYRPPMRQCIKAPLLRLAASERMNPYDVGIYLSADGPMFTEPGVYRIVAELTGLNGSRTAHSAITEIRVRTPDAPTESAAHELWMQPDVLKAMYLGHPLIARDAWNTVEERLQKLALKPDNTTLSYLNFVAGLGWSARFASPNGAEKPPSLEKVLERFDKVNTAGMPSLVAARIKNTRRNQPEQSAAEATSHKVQRYVHSLERSSVPQNVVSRVEDRWRTYIPPSGLFGAIGLATEDPTKATNPFERVVPHLRGNHKFADVVSWNIEHFHNEQESRRVKKTAEFIRTCRCDFWALQEVDEIALKQLVAALNSPGQVRYDYMVVGDSGQQSGAIYRTDTTSVQKLEPGDIFNETLDVEMANGKIATRDVFYRKPLLCEVRVQQSDEKVFDFRCAIVHLKSTDNKIADKGNALRLKAAGTLAAWVNEEYSNGPERHLLVMGDMNAETAQQGLEPFIDGENLKLLSIQMKERHGVQGEGGAITRVASKRLLDHIVVTGDAQIPEEDLDEQIIIRAETDMQSFMYDDVNAEGANVQKPLSDHIPVAVRFILAQDED
ncbi:MAG TPA: endonuclease/exonuclease/phosphatase family protein [Chloroflexia bacterium]|jgi:endonuclease/exonuclease/phosphatase family metal-dependent hydrolase